jgi:hypothetical protein
MSSATYAEQSGRHVLVKSGTMNVLRTTRRKLPTTRCQQQPNRLLGVQVEAYRGCIIYAGATIVLDE